MIAQIITIIIIVLAIKLVLKIDEILEEKENEE